jgi:glutaryl-CoA dehydrogenase
MAVAQLHPATGYVKDSEEFNWEDPLNLDGLLTEEERMVQETARTYCQE